MDSLLASKNKQRDALTLRENEKIFSSWFEALLFALLPAVPLFMLLTKYGGWEFWTSVVAFFLCDLAFGFIGHSIKIISVELQREESLLLVKTSMVLGKIIRRTQNIGSDWTWVRVRMYHNKGDFYLVELGNGRYQCRTILGFGASNSENLVRATEISSKVARFLSIQDKGFVGDA